MSGKKSRRPPLLTTGSPSRLSMRAGKGGLTVSARQTPPPMAGFRASPFGSSASGASGGGGSSSATPIKRSTRSPAPSMQRSARPPLPPSSRRRMGSAVPNSGVFRSAYSRRGGASPYGGYSGYVNSASSRGGSALFRAMYSARLRPEQPLTGMSPAPDRNNVYDASARGDVSPTQLSKHLEDRETKRPLTPPTEYERPCSATLRQPMGSALARRRNTFQQLGSATPLSAYVYKNRGYASVIPGRGESFEPATPNTADDPGDAPVLSACPSAHHSRRRTVNRHPADMSFPAEPISASYVRAGLAQPREPKTPATPATPASDEGLLTPVLTPRSNGSHDSNESNDSTGLCRNLAGMQMRYGDGGGRRAGAGGGGGGASGAYGMDLDSALRRRRGSSAENIRSENFGRPPDNQPYSGGGSSSHGRGSGGVVRHSGRHRHRGAPYSRDSSPPSSAKSHPMSPCSYHSANSPLSR